MTALWRPARPADLPALMDIAARVHPDFPESPEVFAERLALYPAGCRLLAAGETALGYVVSHPWPLGTCPALDSLIHAVPAHAGAYYIHDLALLPAARGTGAAGILVRSLKTHAAGAGFATLALVAVNGSAPFWRAQGFAEALPADPAKLAGYGPDARYMTCRPQEAP